MEKEAFRYRTSWTRPDGQHGSVIFDTTGDWEGKVFDPGFDNYLRSKGCTEIKTVKIEK